MSLLINPFTIQAFIDGVEVPMPPSALHVWYGDAWITPAPEVETNPIPESIAGWQAKTQLHRAGLLADAETAVTDSGNVELQIAWFSAPNFRRDSPNIAAIAKALSLTDAQVDDLFREASKITA